MSEQDATTTQEPTPTAPEQEPQEDAVDPSATDDINPDARTAEQVPGPATAGAFDPNQPVAISPPPPEDQSGTVELSDEQTSGTFHAEANGVDRPDEGEAENGAPDGSQSA